MANFIVDDIYEFNYKNTYFLYNYLIHEEKYNSSTETNFYNGNNILSFLGSGLSVSSSGYFNGGKIDAIYLTTSFRKVYISEMDVSAALISSLARKNTADSMSEIFKNIFSGDDDITLGLGSDIVDAFGGDDVIRGRGGNDTILAGAGDDAIFGGTGMDKLTGGAGADIFVFDTKASSKNIDTITDFSVKSDVIALDHLMFRALSKAGNLSSSAFHVGAKAADASDRIIYNKNDGSLYYDADGVGSVAAIKFAILDKGLALTAGHFDIL